MWIKVIYANLAYAIGTALTSAGLFVLIPILTRYLSPGEFGAWTIFEITILFLTTVMISGMDSGLMRHYDDVTSSDHQSRFAGSVIVAVSLASAMIVLGGCGLLLLGQRTGLPGSRAAIALTIGIAGSESVFTMILNIFRVREMPGTYVALSVARTVGFVSGSTYLMQHGYGLQGALLGRFAATLAATLLAGAFASRFMVLRFSWSLIRPALTYGIALVPTSAALYVMFGADRYVIQHIMTLNDVAVYSFAYKMAAIADIVVTRPFATDWAARRFKIATMPDAPARYAQVMTVYLTLIGSCALCVLAVAPLLYHWFAPPFYESGAKIVPVILLAYVIVGVSNPANVGVMIRDRTVWMPIIGVFAAGVYVAALALMIPRMGLMGAAWATVGAYSVWTLGILTTSLRFYKVPYRVGLLAIIVATGIVALLGIEAMGHAFARSLYLATGLKLAWIGGVVVALVVGRWARSRKKEVQEAVTA